VVTVTSGRQPGLKGLRSRDPSLAGQVLVLQLAVVLAVLALVAVISLRQSGATFQQQSGSQLRGIAEYVADTSQVRTKLEEVDDPATTAVARDTVAELAPALDAALTTTAADEISVLAPDGEVLVGSDPLSVGDRDPLPGRVGAGWSGLRDTASGTVLVARAPVLADDDGEEGRLVGMVLVEQVYPSAWERLTGSAADLALFLGLGTLLGVLGTYVVSRVVKRRTRGLGVGEIARLADHREALLHSIREGVLAVGTDGRVTMVNDAALALLGLGADPVGRPVADLGLDAQVVSLLDGSASADEDAQDVVAVVGERVLVFNRRQASSRGEGIGTVTTMRDRTELVSLQDQLSTNLSITDTLRAQTHEFSNQLHTISGLVELGEHDELRTLVGTLARRRAALTDLVTERVGDRAVAALLIAKSSTAAERGVELELTEDTALRALDPVDSADLITVVGNLVDNAVDACAGRDDAVVSVALQSGTGAVHLEVADTGPGVPEALREAVFVRGFSTKPEVLGGRGIGLPLVQLICARRGGSIELHHQGGAVFSVRMPLLVPGPVAVAPQEVGS